VAVVTYNHFSSLFDRPNQKVICTVICKFARYDELILQPRIITTVGVWVLNYRRR
jgi:hypothetical protein